MLPALRTFAGIWNFHILSKDDNARPIVMAADLVGLHTDQRILPHPFNLPPQRGKAVQAVGVVGEIDGNDVRPIVAGTSKSARSPAASASRDAFLVRILVTSIGYWTALMDFTESTHCPSLPPPAAYSRAHAPEEERICCNRLTVNSADELNFHCNYCARRAGRLGTEGAAELPSSSHPQVGALYVW